MIHTTQSRSVSSVRRLAVLFFVLVALCLAQTNTGRIEGTVQDSSGAVVPNAKVVATNEQTLSKSEAAANSSGNFVITALQPGTYTLTVEVTGFRQTVIKGIDVESAATVSQIIKMQVGQVTESVQVEANAVSVKTADSQVAESITIKDIDTLPQLARTPLTLAIFATPGVQITQNGSSAGTDNSFSHINGMRQGSNNNTLDGIDANDSVAPRLGLSLTANNSDSVEEFRVIADGGKAEYGRNAGGQVQLITRSGTNHYHGNAFEYLRNTDLNANDFFNNSSIPGVARPVFIQNLFGGSFGGPIKHNKLFIFGNYQGRRTAQQLVRNRLVPSDLMRQGIFQWIAPGTSTVQQFNLVSADPRHLGIDPSVAAILKLYPTSNNLGTSDGLNTLGFRFNSPNGSLEDQFTIKADYNMTDKQHIFFRESWQRNSSIDGLNSADAPFPGGVQGTQGGHRWGLSTGHDWTISSSLINEFRYGYQSASVGFLRPERISGEAIIPNTWTNPILANFPQGRNSPVNQFTDNLTWVRSNHTFKFGVNTEWTNEFGTNSAGIFPNVSLSATANGATPTIPGFNTAAANISAADLTRLQGYYNNLLGRVSSITTTYYSDLKTFQPAGSQRVRNFEYHEIGMFAQDDWKVRRNLTINVGVRWDYNANPSEKNGLQGTLQQAADINFVNQISNLTVKPTNQYYNNDYLAFRPRFGFAWDPKGDGKMSIRGGYGIYSDRIIGAVASLVDGNTPGFSQGVPVFPNGTAGADVRLSDNPAAPSLPGAPSLTLPATRSTTIVFLNPNLTTGYVQQFNLNIQRQIARGTVLDIGYVGNRGNKLFYAYDVNQDNIYPDFLNSFQQLQAFQANGTAVPASNTLVKIFGTPAAAISALGSSNVQTGQVRLAADNLDTVPANFNKYAAAGVSQFYLRNYPQYNQIYEGNNNGRSWYNSLQVSLRRQVGAVRLTANYTRSKSIDDYAGEGNGVAEPIDNTNWRANVGRSGFDIPNVFNTSATYTLPVGKGHTFGRGMPEWADRVVGGWDLGGLFTWTSGAPMTLSSGRATGPANVNTWANYSGSRTIGGVSKLGNGVFYFSPAEIAALTNQTTNYPAAGTIGTAGRNTFRGPGFADVDLSLVKKFRITEKTAVAFRAEAYNLANHANFAVPAFNISTPQTFGQITSTVSNPRFMQMALRFDF
jgi:hypothetical protein